MTYGRISSEALKAVAAAKEDSVKCALVVCEKLLPYTDIADDLAQMVSSVRKVVIADEGIKRGGFGVDAEYALMQNRKFARAEFKVLAIEEPPEHGDLTKIYARCGISAESIYKAILN